VIQNVPEKVLDDHVRISALDKFCSLGQGLFRGLDDDADGT
jgi:hypothetical protein